MLEFILKLQQLRLAAEWAEEHAALEGKTSMASVWQLPPRQVGQGRAEGKKNQQSKGLGNPQQWEGEGAT